MILGPIDRSNDPEKILGTVSDHFKVMRNTGLSEVIVVPATGTSECTAIVIGRTTPDQKLSEAALPGLHGVVRAAQARIAQLESEAVPRIAPLSPKEREILFRIAHNKSNTDVGTTLSLSPATIATHLKRAFVKLDANDRATAVNRAVETGQIWV